jgi:hypothetical protein
MTQAVASKSIASAERIKNQLFIGPFLSVFVLLNNVFFSNNLIFNKLLWENCNNGTSGKSQLLLQLSSQVLGKSSSFIRHFRPQQSQKMPAKSWRDSLMDQFKIDCLPDKSCLN